MYRSKLLSLGIPANLRGFEYLNYAMELYTPTQSLMALYRDVAEHFNVTPSKVERCMRTAIEHSIDETQSGRFIAKYKILWEDMKNGIND